MCRKTTAYTIADAKYSVCSSLLSYRDSGRKRRFLVACVLLSRLTFCAGQHYRSVTQGGEWPEGLWCEGGTCSSRQAAGKAVDRADSGHPEIRALRGSVFQNTIPKEKRTLSMRCPFSVNGSIAPASVSVRND